MTMLMTLSFLWTLPLSLVLLSWLGAKLGARAPLMLFLPVPLLISQLWTWHTQGLDAASGAAAATMDSVPMALTWAIPYFHLAPWIDRTVQRRGVAAVITAAVATAIAFGVQALYEPAWALLPGPGAQLGAVAAVLVVSALLLRLPPGERDLVSAVPSPASLVARVLGMMVILFSIAGAFLVPAPVGPLLLAILGAFPRLTFEMALSVHVSNGVTASRQLLSGLPISILNAAVWCYGLVFLPAVLPASAVVPVALTLAVGWWVGLVALYVGLFGVYRKDNGFF